MKECKCLILCFANDGLQEKDHHPVFCHKRLNKFAGYYFVYDLCVFTQVHLFFSNHISVMAVYTGRGKREEANI